jgi:hypothetical protein
MKSWRENLKESWHRRGETENNRENELMARKHPALN